MNRVRIRRRSTTRYTPLVRSRPCPFYLAGAPINLGYLVSLRENEEVVRLVGHVGDITSKVQGLGHNALLRGVKTLLRDEVAGRGVEIAQRCITLT